MADERVSVIDPFFDQEAQVALIISLLQPFFLQRVVLFFNGDAVQNHEGDIVFLPSLQPTPREPDINQERQALGLGHSHARSIHGSNSHTRRGR